MKIEHLTTPERELYDAIRRAKTLLMQIGEVEGRSDYFTQGGMMMLRFIEDAIVARAARRER